MSEFSSLILGLGLFFLGLQLIGQNLRQLSGGIFRDWVKSAMHTPLLAALLGLAAGALMQSATAVTFVMVSMVGSGLIASAAARIVIVWCNVGLTALAFLAAFDIHPLVAYLVGGAGIFMGAVRRKPWNTIAGALLGVGLLLFALGTMSQGAAPLKDAEWFRSGAEWALASPAGAFACGILAAALLQSNTGAAMLVMALESSGLIPIEQAMPLIYGTNLGAIVLRFFLSLGLTGKALRLVRMEDLFCVAGGILMMSLYYAEAAGIPLVRALVVHLTAEPSLQLALVFLLSNLLPALLIMPALPACAALIEKVWPTDPAAAPGSPAFLTSQALRDPATALDLLPKELARMLSLIRVEPNHPDTGDPDNHIPPEIAQLGAAIENFCADLASRSQLDGAQALELQRYRAWLHTIRHVAEAAGEFSATLADAPGDLRGKADELRSWLAANLDHAARATETLESAVVENFYASSKTHSAETLEMRERFKSRVHATGGPERLELSAVLDSFDIAAWLIHRMAKLQRKVVAARNPAVSPVR